MVFNNLTSIKRVEDNSVVTRSHSMTGFSQAHSSPPYINLLSTKIANVSQNF